MLDTNKDIVWFVAISPNDEFITSGSVDKPVSLEHHDWEVYVRTIDGVNGIVMFIAFSPCRKYFASVS